jgi:hypothetical protein
VIRSTFSTPRWRGRQCPTPKKHFPSSHRDIFPRVIAESAGMPREPGNGRPYRVNPIFNRADKSKTHPQIENEALKERAHTILVVFKSAGCMHVSADPWRWVQTRIYPYQSSQSAASQPAVRYEYRSLCHSGISAEPRWLHGQSFAIIALLMDIILRSSSWSNY